MDFIVSANTDIGIKRQTNQDSVSVMVADTSLGAVAFGVMCDGMGGLAKGEMASATVLNAFIEWFKNTLPQHLFNGISDSLIRRQWTEIIVNYNEKIKAYGAKSGIKLGTTISVILLLQNRYYIAHVGDSRVYEINNGCVKQLTEDQTLVAQEVKYGRLTPEQAKTDPRQSVLIQCIGASKTVNPDFYFGNVTQNAVYMLCSDGFRHMISDREIYMNFNSDILTDSNIMNFNSVNLININKQRMEKDNITVGLIRTY